jgi:uncharacterized protein YpuA (DUF1002 family)
MSRSGRRAPVPPSSGRLPGLPPASKPRPPAPPAGPAEATAVLAAQLLATARELDKRIEEAAERYAAPLIDQATEWAAGKVRDSDRRAQATRDVNASLARQNLELQRQVRDLTRQLAEAKGEQQ